MAEIDFLEPFERMMARLFQPADIRNIDAGGIWSDKWQELEESGFLDALVPEKCGGVALTLAQACPLFMALGKFAAPMMIGETMIARMILANADHPAPAGKIALATHAIPTPFDLPADYGIAADDQGVFLGQLQSGASQHADGAKLPGNGRLGRPYGAVMLRYGAVRLARLAAFLRAAYLAGAAQGALDLSITYANQRVQFGKPIGRQQAIQQQLAVMAQQVVAMRMAVEVAGEMVAEIAGGGAGEVPVTPRDGPGLMAVAAAKSLTAQFAGLVANCAHGVHGAIGISAEYDLQLYTRRLQAWARADGGADYWAEMIGTDLIASGASPLDWVRKNLFA